MSGEKEVPEVMYHYTSTNGFKGIVESKTIRAFRYDGMNDPDEFKFGLSHLRDSFKLQEVGEEHHEYAKAIQEQLGRLASHDPSVFLTSFSASGDSLNQWRAYCPDGGVSIGFNRERITRQFLDGFHKLDPKEAMIKIYSGGDFRRFSACDYSNSEGEFDHLEELAAPLFDRSGLGKIGEAFGEFFRSKEGAEIQQFSRNFLSQFCAQLLVLRIALIKHGAYSSEDERRLVHIRGGEEESAVHLGDNNKLFVECPFSLDCIDEVWVSPHGDSTGALNAVEFMKKQLGLSYDIKQSSIPYRVGS